MLIRDPRVFQAFLCLLEEKRKLWKKNNRIGNTFSFEYIFKTG